MACLLTKAYYMTQNYTINDLVRLVYHETSRRQAEELHEEISYDFELAEEYAMLKKAKRELPRVTFSPSQRCLDKILGYSRRKMLAI